MRVMSKEFRGLFKSWEKLRREAADFATTIPRENLISVSQSSDHSEGLIVVWYWGQPEFCLKCGYDVRHPASEKCPECGTPI